MVLQDKQQRLEEDHINFLKLKILIIYNLYPVLTPLTLITKSQTFRLMQIDMVNFSVNFLNAGIRTGVRETTLVLDNLTTMYLYSVDISLALVQQLGAVVNILLLRQMEVFTPVISMF